MCVCFIQDVPFNQPINKADDLKFPTGVKVSNNAKDLLRRLLCRKESRLGSGAGGISEIKNHPFFEGVEWDHLREMPPPIVPETSSSTDTSNFPTLVCN